MHVRCASAKRLSTNRYQQERCDHLRRSFDRREHRRTPQPVTNREPAQVKRCHQEEKNRAECQSESSSRPRCRSAEYEHPVQSSDETGDDRHLHDRSRELRESSRLTDLDVPGEPLPQTFTVLARDEIAHKGMYELPHATPNSRFIDMPNRLWIAAIFAAAPILAMSPVAFPAAHEAGCVRAAQGARREQRAFISLMRSRSRDDAQKLGNYRVEHVRSSDVKLVTDDDVCQRAASAYSNVLRNPKPDRRVTLLKVGDRYVVSDPNFKPDKHRRAVTFDSTFTEPLALVVQ